MTSGQFHHIETSSIIINREERQRREITNVEELADSINRVGLINPIVVSRDLVLVAGERRLTAVRSLGWSHIPCQYVDEIDPSHLRAIELEENIKRVDLPWQDVIRSVQEYHELRRSEKPDWTATDTSSAIGIAPKTVYENLMVAKQLEDPQVASAPKYSVARGLVERKMERAKDAELLKLSKVGQSSAAVSTSTEGTVPSDKAVAQKPESIICADFTQWHLTYSGPKFNFIHCDFPYGIGADQFDQGGAAAHGGYEDSPDTYFTLLDALSASLPRICSDSCHLLFWFSMTFYQETLDRLRKDWDVQPFPLIWFRSDNRGILPDPQRGPRRVYETALLARRGDRKIVRAVANTYAAPTVRDRHMSEKPEPMLGHFLSMLVDQHSIVLDPTCGSGSAIRAAEGLGAAHVLGLELNPEFAERAQLALAKARMLRRAS